MTQELSNKLKNTEKVIKKGMSMELEKLYQVNRHYTKICNSLILYRN